VRPLSPALGAEIVGVDLSKDVDEQICAQLRDAWHRHLVILLRDQELSEGIRSVSRKCSGRRL
jgi:taurine dioxygenase